MKKVLILNASPRTSPKEVVISRCNYNIVVSGKSSCKTIEETIIDDLNRFENIDSVKSFNLKGIHQCDACYACINTCQCVWTDVMKEIYPCLDICTELIIITPLYYATIPAQLTAFFNRLYPYWISSKDINPKTGFPNNYPKLNVYTIGTCADPWQDWKLFDDTLNHIYNEIGWNNKGIYHFPGFSNTEKEYHDIINISTYIGA